MVHSRGPEYALLSGDRPKDDATGHAFRTAPVFTGDALDALGPAVLPQRAVYGRVVSQRADGFPSSPVSPVLYINTNAPFSGLVCGLQGSGKSHSTSVLLESCLMSDPRLGTLPEPLSALVFHFDTAAGGGAVQPCEAAYLSMLDPQNGGDAVAPTVTVLVLPSNIRAMRRVYAKLPAVRVEPLHFSPEDISGERLLAMMRVEENGQMPLYMEAVMTILRSMEDSFDYTKFREELGAQSFSGTQKSMLKLRLSLLDSCLKDGNASNRVSTRFKKGHLTIIDLSSPFMDGSSACGFFDLILGLFVEADVKASGKVVVLDEAHKYLSDAQSGASSRLTDSLLTIIRQYRHLGTRVLVSTQEPTVVPAKLLALCSFIVAHRFQSPEWLRALTRHVAVPERNLDALFAKVVALQTGEAVMFSASGISVRGDSHAEEEPERDAGAVAQLGAGYLIVQSRLRVTQDGGQSILAVREPAGAASGPQWDLVPAKASSSERSSGGTSVPAGYPASGAAPSARKSWAMLLRDKAQVEKRPIARAAEASFADSPSPEPRGSWRGASPSLPARSGWGATSPSPTPTTSHPGRGASSSSPSVNLGWETAPPSPVEWEASPAGHGAPSPSPAERETDDSSNPTAPAGPTVFMMTSLELRKFRPLVKFMQKMLQEEKLWRVRTQRVRGALDLEPDDIIQATQLGLVVRAEGTGPTRIMLTPGAEYVTERTVYLTGALRSCVPLVQYLAEQASAGFHEINAATIRRRFGQEVEEVITDAKAQGVVEDVPNAPNRKIRLCPHTQVVF